MSSEGVCVPPRGKVEESSTIRHKINDREASKVQKVWFEEKTVCKSADRQLVNLLVVIVERRQSPESQRRS